MIVVDTNVIAYLFLSGPHSAVVERLLQQDQEWAAPLLWRSELRNVLSGYLRRGQLTPVAAGQIMRRAEALMAGREYAVSSEHVLRLVAVSDRSAYDCEFVALAEDLGVPMVTADSRLQSSFPQVTIALESFA